MNNSIVRHMVVGLLGGGLTPLLLAGDPVDEVQKSAAEWAKLRAETVRIESEWDWQRVLMESTRDAQVERARQLEEKRSELEARTANERKLTDELVARRQAMGVAAVAAEKRLQEIDARLVQMRGWLPPRLSAALELPFRSLSTPEPSLGERMQYTMAILNRCAHFNRTISYGEETVNIPGGETKLLEVVYWGLSHGYALDRAAGMAYVGAPGATGWMWSPAPELKTRVGRLIAICQDKTEPECVELPMQINDPAALNPQS